MRHIQHNDFVIGFPDGWLDVSTVILAGPPKDNYGPSITVTRERLDSAQTATQYAAKQLPALQREFGEYGYRTRQEGPLVLGSLSAFQRTHSFVMPEQGLEIQQWQVYMILGNEAITITCTDSAVCFQASMPCFQEAIRQFRFMKT